MRLICGRQEKDGAITCGHEKSPPPSCRSRNGAQKLVQKSPGLIYRAQNIIRKHGLNENTSLENFTWAQNGAGAHSQKAAKHVTDRLVAADKAGGKQRVLDELTLLRRDLTDGNFY